MAADTGSKEEKGDITSPNYKGPDENFPFTSFRTTGFIHLVLGISVQFLSVVQLSMGAEHRDIFLQFAAAPLWCPIPVISVGVLGICMSRKRYWEVRCLKVCFGVMSLINALLFMVVMGSLVGFYGFYYYSVTTFVPAEADEELRIDETTGYTVLVVLILVIAGVEVLVSFFSFFICCCCAHVKRPNEAKKPTATPQDVPTVAKRRQNVAASMAGQAQTASAAAAAPVGPPGAAPVQYALVMSPGSPQGGAMLMSPGSPPAGAILMPAGSGYPPGTFMVPAGVAPPTASPPAQVAPAASQAPSAKSAKQPKATKNATVKVTKKKKKETAKKPQAAVNPEKQSPQTFTLQVPEYMRQTQPATVHGNGVPQGFVTSSAGTASAYSSGPYGTYASIPSVMPPNAPPAYAPGYESSPAYEYYTNIPGN